jgi:hypothetical protein
MGVVGQLLFELMLMTVPVVLFVLRLLLLL